MKFELVWGVQLWIGEDPEQGWGWQIVNGDIADDDNHFGYENRIDAFRAAKDALREDMRFIEAHVLSELKGIIEVFEIEQKMEKSKKWQE